MSCRIEFSRRPRIEGGVEDCPNWAICIVNDSELLSDSESPSVECDLVILLLLVTDDDDAAARLSVGGPNDDSDASTRCSNGASSKRYIFEKKKKNTNEWIY